MDHNKVSELLEKIREVKPLVHNITNIVVSNFTANGLLALGASPVMANAPEEAGEMAKLASSLVLNIGTLTTQTVESMILAGKSANKHDVPVIFDPVGAGATRFRTESAHKILNEVDVSIIRGNVAEIANVIGEKWEIKGVDAGEAKGDVVNLAITAAQMLKCIVAITGKEDIVTDGNTTYAIANGHPMLTKVTGGGCLLSSVAGAFAAVENNYLNAAVAALTFYGVTAEKAAEKTADLGPGSFQIEFLNQLSRVSAGEIHQTGSFKRV